MAGCRVPKVYSRPNQRHSGEVTKGTLQRQAVWANARLTHLMKFFQELFQGQLNSGIVV